MSRALLIIDIQNDYFAGGAYPLAAPESAAEVAAQLLTTFRSTGEAVVHVQHVWDEPEASFMRPGTAGVDIHPSVRPHGDEPVVTKAYPNAFRQTDLDAQLRSSDVDELVVVGMMTSMCVDATVRAAADLDYRVTVISDGCANPALEFAGRTVEAEDVHAAFLAALGDSYATVCTLSEFTAAAL
ncbi:cysteine hydrolase [Jatrophihabitans telluris]|uniref:Cysteine hydrolase n=1 Tax=Jatrophihabitans telluris TaxID=2038343 RepID=A0ABY4R1N8_9ACTN|nr:cysteine hydrolase family protein [Jatrophihabitans telluris]UQX89764.1 cysteine hydrolase [Jatrophihabitans telluris]